MPITISGVPANVVSALERLKADLTNAAGDNFAGLILYGGVARGRYRPGKSDVNVLVLLRDASANSLATIAPALRTAWRAVAVEPLILTPAELPDAARAFPIKFLDIKNHHIVLAGENDLSQLVVPREMIRLRIEQELRNHLLRLRHALILSGRDSVGMARILSKFARPFALELAALLSFAGKPSPAEDRTAAIFESASAAFGLKPEPLARLAVLRQNPRPAGDMVELFRETLDAIAKVAGAVHAMGEARP